MSCQKCSVQKLFACEFLVGSPLRAHRHRHTHRKVLCLIQRHLQSLAERATETKAEWWLQERVFYILPQLSHSWNCHISLTETSRVFFFSFVFVASCSSQVKYRQKPESLKFTAVVDSPSLIHAKNSYLQCNDVGFILMYN